MLLHLPLFPCAQVGDYYIRWWTRDEFKKYLPNCVGYCNGFFYVRIYAILALALFIGLMLFRGAFLYLWCLGASERIHKKGIHRLLYAPLGFFLTVSWEWSGRWVGALHAPAKSFSILHHCLPAQLPGFPASFGSIPARHPPTHPPPSCRRPLWVICW